MTSKGIFANNPFTQTALTIGSNSSNSSNPTSNAQQLLQFFSKQNKTDKKTALCYCKIQAILGDLKQGLAKGVSACDSCKSKNGAKYSSFKQIYPSNYYQDPMQRAQHCWRQKGNFNFSFDLENLGKFLRQVNFVLIFLDVDYFLHVQKFSNQLSVQNLQIENSHGKIIFMEPVNLKLLASSGRLRKWVEITNSSLTVYHQQLNNKICYVQFKDYKDYSKMGVFRRSSTEVDLNQMLRNAQDKVSNAKFDNTTGHLSLIVRNLL